MQSAVTLLSSLSLGWLDPSNAASESWISYNLRIRSLAPGRSRSVLPKENNRAEVLGRDYLCRSGSPRAPEGRWIQSTRSHSAACRVSWGEDRGVLLRLRG